MHSYSIVFGALLVLAVHSSGAIRPSTTNDSQHRCGSVLCQTISELFSKAKLNFGYNYVATIPAGAMNLTVKQMSRSDNFLAIKSTDDIFIINGNNRASESGTFEYNEDVYDYNRELGMITSRGPLLKPVVLLVFARGLNTGIKYDYTVPVSSASIGEDEEMQMQWNELGQPIDDLDDNYVDGTVSAQLTRARERKRRKFTWKLLGFGQCNRSCGPGVQPPIFRCIRDSPTRFYSPKRCAFAEKPTFSEDIYHCNRGLCPAFWRAGDFGECQCAEGAVEGERTRYVRCVQEQITGKIAEVAEELCKQEKLPELKEICNCPKLLRRKIYSRGQDRPQKVYSRLIGSIATVRHPYNVSMLQRRHIKDERERERVDKTGVWLMSDWNQQCSDSCQPSFEFRSIYCDRTPPNTDLCDLRFTPEQKRVCSPNAVEQNKPKFCPKGEWFASEWSNCTGDCFSLQRKRIVHCLRDNTVVEDAECSGSERPKNIKECSPKEVNYCGPKWHYSEWSECSRTCGDGVQRRYAKCLDYDWKQNTMIESNNCKYLDREPVYGACNVQKCAVLSGSGSAVDPKFTAQDEDDDEETCSDDFANCKRINRQRLCKLQYYQTFCCQTCQGFF